MIIYVLETYEHVSYSYSGISVDERFYFSSKEKAQEKANSLKLIVKEYPETHKDAAILVEVLDEE